MTKKDMWDLYMLLNIHNVMLNYIRCVYSQHAWETRWAAFVCESWSQSETL